MRIVATNQLTLELQPSLLQRYTTLRQCVWHTALNYSRGLKALAADLDLSESELTRSLNPSENDPRRCDVNLMDRIIEVTEDTTPIQWQMAKHLRDKEARRSAAVDQLAQLMPQIATLLVDAGVTPAKGRAR